MSRERARLLMTILAVLLVFIETLIFITLGEFQSALIGILLATFLLQLVNSAG